MQNIFMSGLLIIKLCVYLCTHFFFLSGELVIKHLPAQHWLRSFLVFLACMKILANLKEIYLPKCSS